MAPQKAIRIFETQRSRRLQRRNEDERKRRPSEQMTPLAAALSSSRVSTLRTTETSADSFPRIAHARKQLVYLYGTFNVVKLNTF